MSLQILEKIIVLNIIIILIKVKQNSWYMLVILVLFYINQIQLYYWKHEIDIFSLFSYFQIYIFDMSDWLSFYLNDKFIIQYGN